MYRVHPDDARRLARQGMPIMALREDFIANGPTHPGMADFFEKGNGFAPEMWADEVQEIGSRMASSKPGSSFSGEARTTDTDAGPWTDRHHVGTRRRCLFVRLD